MDISERLDLAMREARITSQSELSRLSGVPQPTIARILNNPSKKGPETGTITKLAAATKVSFSWLMTEEGPMHGVVDHLLPKSQISDERNNVVMLDSEVYNELLRAQQARSLQWLDFEEQELLTLFRGTDDKSRKMMLIHGRAMPRVVDVRVVGDKS